MVQIVGREMPLDFISRYFQKRLLAKVHGNGNKLLPWLRNWLSCKTHKSDI